MENIPFYVTFVKSMPYQEFFIELSKWMIIGLSGIGLYYIFKRVKGETGVTYNNCTFYDKKIKK